MAVDADTVLTRFPVLEGADEEAIDLAIAESTLECPADIWTDESYRDVAITYLTAHKLRLERRDSFQQAAALKALKVDKDYEIDQSHYSLDYYKQTIYGQYFLTIRKRVLGSRMFVV